MQRVYIADERFGRVELELDREESRQLRTVLRAEPGMTVEVFDGQGKTVVMTLARVEKNRITLTGARQIVEHRPPACELVLVQCLAKGKRMDWIVEKAVEIGASCMVPVISERTIVRLNEKEARSRLDRWQRIAVETARQCQTPWLPQIEPVQDLARVLETEQYDWQAVATLEPVPRQSLKALLTGQPARAAILIGPEGDLTTGEVALAMDNGWQPTSFGTHVLRTETAAVYALSAMHCAWCQPD